MNLEIPPKELAYLAMICLGIILTFTGVILLQLEMRKPIPRGQSSAIFTSTDGEHWIRVVPKEKP